MNTVLRSRLGIGGHPSTLPRQRVCEEHGSLAVFVAVFSTSLFVLIGLVVDGARTVAAHAKGVDQAQQAARVGAAQLSVRELRSGVIALDPASAVGAAEKYLSVLGERGTVTVSGNTVTVRLALAEPTVILGLVGINQISVSASANATDVHGVARTDQ